MKMHVAYALIFCPLHTFLAFAGGGAAAAAAAAAESASAFFFFAAAEVAGATDSFLEN